MMRVLVDCGDYRCGNMGDVAMLQVTLARLAELWPGASLHVLTADPGALAIHAPGAIPASCAGRTAWFADRALLGGTHDRLPSGLSARAVRATDAVRNHCPSLFSHLLHVRARHDGPTRGDAGSSVVADIDAFLADAHAADVHVLVGAGGITDHASRWALPVLRLLEYMAVRGTPTAMFGQGIGPLTDPEISRRVRSVIPRVRFVALREALHGVPLLESLGVSTRSMHVSGDDAIELAYAARQDATVPAGARRDGIGVNLRVSLSSGVPDAITGVLRPVFHAFASRVGGSLLPAPIDRSDEATIDRLLDAGEGAAAADGALRTPGAVIRQVGRCRIVATGAYHAAVFALSQGIPVVCFARSDYFRVKFDGLADQFGVGCEVVPLDGDDLAVRVKHALERAWLSADDVREPLLQAARRQILASRAGYAEWAKRVAEHPRRPRAHARPAPADAEGALAR